jgi:hypothetical protein
LSIDAGFSEKSNFLASGFWVAPVAAGHEARRQKVDPLLRAPGSCKLLFGRLFLGDVATTAIDHAVSWNADPRDPTVAAILVPVTAGKADRRMPPIGRPHQIRRVYISKPG